MFNNHIKSALMLIVWCLCPALSLANPTDVELAVWANEAIIATYTIDHEHFIEQEKAIGKYFTAEGWIGYSKALQASNLPKQIVASAFDVSAVATLPPTVRAIDHEGWEATMPILVLYKNASYTQKQELQVILRFIASNKEGVRGFAITSLKSTVIQAPCRCEKREPSATIV